MKKHLLCVILIFSLSFILVACTETCSHKWNDATCTTPKQCTLCNITESEALGHDYSMSNIEEATCVSNGIKTFICSRCKDSYTEDIAAVGHSYVETVKKEATCETAGEKAFTCSKCGDKKSEPIDATGHKWKDATCTEAKTCSICGASEGKALGYTDGEICSRCGKSLRTIGQSNAVKSAKSYISFSGFSRDGLVKQLEYEEYSHEDAVYGADNCGANWMEQALKSAKSYLSFSAFSYKGLIKQLEYEKFTAEEAKYAAENCDANWNEQAAKSAKSYLDFSAFSRDRLIAQLEYEGFTYEQAVYGVTANGY